MNIFKKRKHSVLRPVICSLLSLSLVLAFMPSAFAKSQDQLFGDIFGSQQKTDVQSAQDEAVANINALTNQDVEYYAQRGDISAPQTVELSELYSSALDRDSLLDLPTEEELLENARIMSTPEFNEQVAQDPAYKALSDTYNSDGSRGSDFQTYLKQAAESSDAAPAAKSTEQNYYLQHTYQLNEAYQKAQDDVNKAYNEWQDIVTNGKPDVIQTNSKGEPTTSYQRYIAATNKLNDLTKQKQATDYLAKNPKTTLADFNKVNAKNAAYKAEWARQVTFAKKAFGKAIADTFSQGLNGISSCISHELTKTGNKMVFDWGQFNNVMVEMGWSTLSSVLGCVGMLIGASNPIAGGIIGAAGGIFKGIFTLVKSLTAEPEMPGVYTDPNSALNVALNEQSGQILGEMAVNQQQIMEEFDKVQGKLSNIEYKQDVDPILTATQETTVTMDAVSRLFDNTEYIAPSTYIPDPALIEYYLGEINASKVANGEPESNTFTPTELYSYIKDQITLKKNIIIAKHNATKKSINDFDYNVDTRKALTNNDYRALFCLLNALSDHKVDVPAAGYLGSSAKLVEEVFNPLFFSSPRTPSVFTKINEALTVDSTKFRDLASTIAAEVPGFKMQSGYDAYYLAAVMSASKNSDDYYTARQDALEALSVLYAKHDRLFTVSEDIVQIYKYIKEYEGNTGSYLIQDIDNAISSERVAIDKKFSAAYDQATNAQALQACAAVVVSDGNNSKTYTTRTFKQAWDKAASGMLNGKSSFIEVLRDFDSNEYGSVACELPAYNKKDAQPGVTIDMKGHNCTYDGNMFVVLNRNDGSTVDTVNSNDLRYFKITSSITDEQAAAEQAAEQAVKASTVEVTTAEVNVAKCNSAKALKAWNRMLAQMSSSKKKELEEAETKLADAKKILTEAQQLNQQKIAELNKLKAEHSASAKASFTARKDADGNVLSGDNNKVRSFITGLNRDRAGSDAELSILSGTAGDTAQYIAQITNDQYKQPKYGQFIQSMDLTLENLAINDCTEKAVSYLSAFRDSLNVKGCSFDNNTLGAVETSVYSAMNFTDTTFTNNKANNGGAVHLVDNVSVNAHWGTPFVDYFYCVIGNDTKRDNGHVKFEQGCQQTDFFRQFSNLLKEKRVAFIRCTFSNNEANVTGTGNGGAIMIDTPSFFTKGFFEGYQWFQASCSKIGNIYPRYNERTVHLGNSGFCGCHKNYKFDDNFDHVRSISCYFYAEGCLFENNKAGQYGGAIYQMHGKDGSKTIPVYLNFGATSCTFKGNSAKEGGAYAYTNGGDFTNWKLNNTNWGHNRVRGKVNGANKYPFGASRLFRGYHNFCQCTFEANTATKWGGAIFVSYGNVGANGTLKDNSAPQGPNAHVQWASWINGGGTGDWSFNGNKGSLSQGDK